MGMWSLPDDCTKGDAEKKSDSNDLFACCEQKISRTELKPVFELLRESFTPFSFMKKHLFSFLQPFLNDEKYERK
ncbi:MAG: hypothetical protein HQM10_15815 [Candidatus Riflebacteria bacterium]|nr:hypothetical protein [Candidatus Riflebacteria bacterium]